MWAAVAASWKIMLQHAVSASSLVPVAGGHRDTIIQVKTIALWSVLQHSRAMVVVVVVLYDEGCLTAVTSMNSSRGRVPALLNQHDGHHHAGRGGECAKWCLVCSLRDRTTAVGAKDLVGRSAASARRRCRWAAASCSGWWDFHQFLLENRGFEPPPQALSAEMA